MLKSRDSVVAEVYLAGCTATSTYLNMSFYKEQMRELLARWAGDWLRVHGSPRATAILAMAFGLLAAYVCSCALMSLGVCYIPTRFALNSLCGYSVFVIVLGCWFLRVRTMPAESLQFAGQQQIKTVVPGESKFDKDLEAGIDEVIRQARDQQKELGLVGLLLAAGFLGLIAVSCHFVVHAPWYLGKMMVDGGKVRHRSTSSGSRLDFLVLPLRQTWPVAILVVLHYTTVGAALQHIVLKR